MMGILAGQCNGCAALLCNSTNPNRRLRWQRVQKFRLDYQWSYWTVYQCKLLANHFQQEAQVAFRKTSVIEDITNNDYFGEISNIGDSVRIIKEPDITVNAYTRGTDISQQALTDADFTMIIDMANYFSFKLDDLEDAITTLTSWNWQQTVQLIRFVIATMQMY